MFTVRYIAILATVLASVSVLAWRALGKRGYTRTVRTVVVLLVAGLAAGTCSHVENLVRLGLIPLPDQPLAFNFFWTSLTLLDPLGALLLIVRPRVGILLTVAIMTADVTVNTIAFGQHGMSWANNSFLYCQTAYGLFALATAPYVWRGAGRSAASHG